LADTQRSGRHHEAAPQGVRTPVRHRHRARLAAVIGATGVAVALVLAFAVQDAWGPAEAVPSTAKPQPTPRGRFVLPAIPDSYIGLYPDGVPESYAGVTAFTAATGVKPSVVLYYSGWLEPFHASFATTVRQHGAVPLVQMDPDGVKVASMGCLDSSGSTLTISRTGASTTPPLSPRPDAAPRRIVGLSHERSTVHEGGR
jgi:hypothetical protein